MFVGKFRTTTSPAWNISVAFFESCLSISEANECQRGYEEKPTRSEVR